MNTYTIEWTSSQAKKPFTKEKFKQWCKEKDTLFISDILAPTAEDALTICKVNFGTEEKPVFIFSIMVATGVWQKVSD